MIREALPPKLKTYWELPQTGLHRREARVVIGKNNWWEVDNPLDPEKLYVMRNVRFVVAGLNEVTFTSDEFARAVEKGKDRAEDKLAIPDLSSDQKNTRRCVFSNASKRKYIVAEQGPTQAMIVGSGDLMHYEIEEYVLPEESRIVSAGFVDSDEFEPTSEWTISGTSESIRGLSRARNAKYQREVLLPKLGDIMHVSPDEPAETKVAERDRARETQRPSVAPDIEIQILMDNVTSYLAQGHKAVAQPLIDALRKDFKIDYWEELRKQQAE